jgi:hypothetical protein
MAKVFINSKDTVSVRDIDELESHVGGTFHGILIAAGRAETAVAAERDELKVAAFWTAVHSAAKRRVTTVNHLLDIIDHSVARMKSIYHFFIMIGKDSLKDIHEISMKEMKEKENPNPLMNEGKGS